MVVDQGRDPLITGLLSRMPSLVNCNTAPGEHEQTNQNQYKLTSFVCIIDQSCFREMASCLLDSDCIESMTCSSSCAGDSFVAGLCAYECGERGLKSETYVDMMLCFGTHRY